MDSGGPDAEAKLIRVRFPPQADMGVEYATGVLVNFTGGEFLISLVQVVPPPFGDPKELPEEVEGRILFRAAMTPAKWVEAVDSFETQIRGLREQGTLPPPSVQS